MAPYARCVCALHARLRKIFVHFGGVQNWVTGLKSLSAHSKVDGEASLNGNSTFFRSSKVRSGSGFLKPTTQGR